MMSQPKKQKRSLGFECLEAKSSLTSLIGWVDTPPTAEFGPQESGDAGRFLQYVATLDEISIERDAPDATETLAVDQWLVHAAPPRAIG